MSGPNEPIYFKAVLRPSPPLPTHLRALVIVVVAAFNLSFALMFVLRGAWPVTPFMGADVLFLAWALSSSSKSANRREEVRLTRSELRVDYHPPRGPATCSEMNPYWVRIYLDEPTGGRSAVILASHGRRLQIGAFLALRDRISLVEALKSALEDVRQL
jgi:uncharacterized membrane protein